MSYKPKKKKKKSWCGNFLQKKRGVFGRKKVTWIQLMYLTKQLQHENLVQSIKTITKFTKCLLYIQCWCDMQPRVIVFHLLHIYW